MQTFIMITGFLTSVGSIVLLRRGADLLGKSIESRAVEGADSQALYVIRGIGWMGGGFVTLVLGGGALGYAIIKFVGINVPGILLTVFALGAIGYLTPTLADRYAMRFRR